MRELPERILIVEDDESIRVLLCKCFEKNAEVIAVADAERAVQEFQKQRPDFVITDLSLPGAEEGMDGHGFIQKIRSTHLGATVPIMVLTANGREDVLLDCFREGADDFMVKPFSLQELRMRVSSIYLRQQTARDANPLTRLPGNLTIKKQIARWAAQKTPFAVAYIDIDHFKAFNDSRGFDAGDEVIQLLAELLMGIADERSPMFVGHVGGDDFVVLMGIEKVHSFAEAVHNGFSERTGRYYSAEERNRGTIKILNRRAEHEEVPLLSISIGVVTTERPGLDDFRRIAHVASEVKQVAKRQPGNSLFIERRRWLGSAAEKLAG